MSRHLWLGRLLLVVLLFAPAPLPAQIRIEAPSGVAAQSISNSVINIYNRDPEEIKRLSQRADRSDADRRAAEAKAAELAHQLDLSNVTTQTVVGFLRILARQPDLKLEQVPTKMAEITASYVQMQERLATLSPQDPTAADLARQAEEAGRAGHFEEADRLLEQAEARETAAIEEHRVKVAELRAARGDNAATQLHYTEAARHYEAAAALLPPSGSGTKAVYLIQAGDMWLTSGNSAAALTSYQASHDIFERLAKADPGNAGWQRDLSVSHNRIGDVQQAQGNLAAALTSYQASLAIRERLAKADPGNAGWQRDVSVSQDNIGDVQQAQGDLAAALTSYQASLAIRERLAKADPGNAGWQRDLALSCGRVAVIKLQQGIRDDALKLFGQGREIIAQLTRRSPDNATLQRDLAWFDSQMGTHDK
jgi:tetratricopeptide (TPR) repeat protein